MHQVSCVSTILTVCSGDIPLHIDIRETSDEGKPIVISNPDSPQVRLSLVDVAIIIQWCIIYCLVNRKLVF